MNALFPIIGLLISYYKKDLDCSQFARLQIKVTIWVRNWLRTRQPIKERVSLFPRVRTTIRPIRCRTLWRNGNHLHAMPFDRKTTVILISNHKIKLPLFLRLQNLTADQLSENFIFWHVSLQFLKVPPTISMISGT